MMPLFHPLKPSNRICILVRTLIPVVLSGLGLFLSSWILIPAPTFALLPLAVGAPELSPLLLLANGIALAIALIFRNRSRFRWSAIGCCVLALLLCSLPCLQLPATLQQANAAMHTALGQQYLDRIPAALQKQLRPQPLVLAELFTGLPAPKVRQNRVQFAAPDGVPLWLELYRPSTIGRYPALVTVYGGAWQRGDPSQNDRFNRYMAAQGYTVVAIDYRHAPRYRFPVQLEDVQTALRFIVQQAEAYEIDAAHIALVGWSAGAHLALLAAYQPEALPVAAVVSYYGPTDLLKGYRDPPDPDPIDTRAVLEAFLGGSPEQLPQHYEVASPLHWVRPKLPPTLLIYGERDHIVKAVFGQDLHERLRASGNKAVLLQLPWAEHAFDAVGRGIGNQLSLYYTERFLAWALRGAANTEVR